MTAVSIIGLGKLGASLLAVMATKHDVIGVDLDRNVVAALNAGAAPVVEPGLAGLLAANRERYCATTDVAEVAGTDVTFVIVPTPSDPSGVFSNRYVLQAVAGVGKAINGKTSPHLVVITSTVMPGSTLGPIATALRMNAAKELGPQLMICYAPEFVALGSVIADMRRPDMLLIGESDPAAGDHLEELLRTIVLNNPPAARLTVPEAEIAKLCVNAYVTTKISFANTLAEVCEHVPNTDAVKIAMAIGMDSRIGPAYLRPASAFSGTCFPRDNAAFIAFASSVGAVAPIAEATVAVNDRQVDRLANLIERIVPMGARVGILGMAYKPNTPVIDKSVGVGLAEEMLSRGYRIVVHDPLAMGPVRETFGRTVEYAATADLLLATVDAAVFAQPCGEYLSLEDELGALPVVDVWAMFHRRTCLRPGIYNWGLP